MSADLLLSQVVHRSPQETTRPDLGDPTGPVRHQVYVQANARTRAS